MCLFLHIGFVFFESKKLPSLLNNYGDTEYRTVRVVNNYITLRLYGREYLQKKIISLTHSVFSKRARAQVDLVSKPKKAPKIA